MPVPDPEYAPENVPWKNPLLNVPLLCVPPVIAGLVVVNVPVPVFIEKLVGNATLVPIVKLDNVTFEVYKLEVQILEVVTLDPTDTIPVTFPVTVKLLVIKLPVTAKLLVLVLELVTNKTFDALLEPIKTFCELDVP